MGLKAVPAFPAPNAPASMMVYGQKFSAERVLLISMVAVCGPGAKLKVVRRALICQLIKQPLGVSIHKDRKVWRL